MTKSKKQTTLHQTETLLNVMARLRDPDSGCAWDIEQSFETIAPYTVEEAYEVADAIERKDAQALREELGDLLLQVVFHAQIAKDQGLFEFEDVAQSIASKMIERHPHVFGDTVFDSVDAQKAHWELLKQQEREKRADECLSALDGVALALPALTRAEKIQKRAARVGFDWCTVEPVLDKLDEEVSEFKLAVEQGSVPEIENEIGDLLFTVVNIARHLKVDAEQALKQSTSKFESRFKYVENTVNADDKSMEDVDEVSLDKLWRDAKQSH